MGIYGLITRRQLQRDIVHKMSGPFGGPDNVHVIREDNILLGARRKSILRGRQDTVSSATESGLRIIFWGEILNRHEIIDYLRGRGCDVPSNAGDADLFSHLYRETGSSAVKKIAGLFCAAVWDSKNRKLHLLLDRTGGIHGLYYSVISDGFAFSTSIPGLLCIPGISNEIDPYSLYDFFTTGYVLPPDTLLKRIKKVRPGEEIAINAANELTSRMIDTIEVTPRSDIRAEASELRELLARAIQRTSADDVRKSYLLSGGIDSSILVALASGIDNSRPRTFTASFPGSELDESAFARIVADRYECESNIIDLNRNDLIEDLPKIVWHLDEPSLDYSVIPTFHLFKEIRKHSPVVVSGDGPDHLFGRYYPLAAKRALAPLSSVFHLLSRISKISFFEQVYRVSRGDLLKAYREIFIIPQWGIENLSRMEEFFSPDFRRKKRESQQYLDLKAFRSRSFADFFNELTFIDYYVDGSFGVFAKIGKMAKANDLLVREPYLDRDVLDFVLGLPIRKKVSGSFTALLRSKGKSKYLLKHELGPQMLPDRIIDKPKGGFTPPLTDWLKDTICRLPVDRILCPFILRENYFNLPFLKRVLREHKAGYRDWSSIIFMLISFDLWIRVNIENQMATAPEWKLSDIYGKQSNRQL